MRTFFQATSFSTDLREQEECVRLGTEASGPPASAAGALENQVPRNTGKQGENAIEASVKSPPDRGVKDPR